MKMREIACDVLVAGGGAAGIAAATAAGRAGARVVLLERYGFLGGLATAAEVGTICGLFLRDSVREAPEPVAGGFAQEFSAQLQRASGAKPLRVPPGLWVLPYAPLAFARVADAFVSGAGDVRIILHATMAEAPAEKNRIARIRALAWNQLVEVVPKSVVDCTGEATSAALAGASVEEGAADQSPSLVFVLEDVDPGLVQRGLVEVRRELRRGVESGLLPAQCERISLVPGAGPQGRLALKLTLVPAKSDSPHWQQVADWERQSRALIGQLAPFLIENVPSCKDARLNSVAPQLGVRSGRRIQGRARLGDDAVLAARKTEGGIARGCWPMERWGVGPKPEMTFFAERDYYEIPLDCLRQADLDNVWAAGRCLCAEAGAMTSARVIGTALATGWAAGTAAAYQALDRPIEEAIAAIRGQNNAGEQS